MEATGDQGKSTTEDSIWPNTFLVDRTHAQVMDKAFDEGRKDKARTLNLTRTPGPRSHTYFIYLGKQLH